MGLTALIGIPLLLLRAYVKDRKRGLGLRNAGINSGNFLNDPNSAAYWLSQPPLQNTTLESARRNEELRKRLGRA
jgi:hypothetical protein